MMPPSDGVDTKDRLLRCSTQYRCRTRVLGRQLASVRRPCRLAHSAVAASSSDRVLSRLRVVFSSSACGSIPLRTAGLIALVMHVNTQAYWLQAGIRTSIDMGGRARQHVLHSCRASVILLSPLQASMRAHFEVVALGLQMFYLP